MFPSFPTPESSSLILESSLLGEAFLVLKRNPEEHQGPTHGSVRVSRALEQLRAASSGLLSLFMSTHTAQTAVGSQDPSGVPTLHMSLDLLQFYA